MAEFDKTFDQAWEALRKQSAQLLLQTRRFAATLQVNRYLSMPSSGTTLNRQLICNLISPIPDILNSVEILNWVKFISDIITEFHVPEDTILYDVWIGISKEKNIDIFSEV